MQNYSQYYKARDIIEEFMVKDLIGPVAEDEVLDESPLNYYLMGKLYPQADIESDAITKEEGDIRSLYRRGNLCQDGGTAHSQRDESQSADCLPASRRAA